jgi:hypothetical protein
MEQLSAPTIHPSGTDIWRVISLFTYLLTFNSLPKNVVLRTNLNQF